MAADRGLASRQNFLKPRTARDEPTPMTALSDNTPPMADADQPPHRLDLLALFGFLSIVTLAAGGWLTMLGLGPWYDQLKVPWFQPPAWAFTPAWTMIFILLAFATHRVARLGSVARIAIAVYAVQMILNILWSLFFFPMQSPELALVDAIALDVVIVSMIVLYGRIDRIAGWMLVPYGVWMILATAINTWVVLNN